MTQQATMATKSRQKSPVTRRSVVLDLIGNTPLVPLRDISERLGHSVSAKLEYTNPSGSIKDRMALYIVEDAEAAGKISPGDLLIDNSSGNTAVAVGLVGSCKGYRTLFSVPDKTSKEKIDMIRAMGSEVVVCPTDVPHDHPDSYYSTARRLAKERPGFLIDQYHNPKNIECHERTTGPEIWQQTKGEIDVVVAGIGTGGTLSGVGRFMKSQNPNIRIVAVDPIGSIFHDLIRFDRLGEPGRYFVEGLGTDVPCGALDASVIDEIVQIDDQVSFDWARYLIRTEGMMAGGSSGSAIAGLMDWASRQPGHLRIVTILPDHGMRYLTKFLNDDWLTERGFEVKDRP